MPISFQSWPVSNVMDRHRFNADPDPDPTLHFGADPDMDQDPTPSLTLVGKSEIFILLFTAVPVLKILGSTLKFLEKHIN
jgi:hypothetical protein